MTMKRRRPIGEDPVKNLKKPRSDNISESGVTELLKRCLQKVCELQANLAHESDDEDDAEAAGYAACAVETLRFLTAEGLPPDHPVVKGLSQKLLSHKDDR